MVQWAELPDQTKKVVKAIKFSIALGGTGAPYYTLKFDTPKTEHAALQAMIKFMSVKIDKEWCDTIGEDFEKLRDEHSYCTRGDLLEDHRIYEGSDFKGGTMMPFFGS